MGPDIKIHNFSLPSNDYWAFLFRLILTDEHSTGFKQGGRAEQPNGPRHSQLCLPRWFPHKTKWNSKICHPFSTPTPQENTHIHPSRISRHHKKNKQLHTNTLHRMHLHRGHGHHNQEHQAGHRHHWEHHNIMRSSPSLLHHHSHEHHPLQQSPETKRKNHKTTLHPALQHNADTQVEKIIDQVNNYITGKNIKHQVSTPYCHSAIKTRKGRTKHFNTNNWEGLYDGVHASQETTQKWANSINTSIKYNRTYRKCTLPSDSEDDTTKSPKRSWRREWKVWNNQPAIYIWNPLFSWQLIKILM